MPTFEKAVLPNGLTIIGEIDPAAHSAAIGFFVKTGARDEAPAAMGVSHFLEHMMFKGTATRSAEDVDRDFDALGADHNAFTTSEMTAFYAHCLPEALPEAEAILADIMRPALRGPDFDAEKHVILEEIAMYRDQPFWVLYEQLMERYYGPHPLGHRVLGTDETITALERDVMQAYFDHRYSADNTVVAVAGQVDFEAMTGRIAEHCGAWPRTGAARDAGPTPFAPGELDLVAPTATQHYLMMLCPGPATTDPRRYAAGVLMQILGDSDGSRLYWALVDPGIADEAQAQHHGRDGVGEMIVHAVCAPDNADEVERLIGAEIDALVDSLTDDDLLRVRNRIATAVTLHGELPAGRMRRLGRQWTYHGAYRSLEDELASIEAVTLDDLRAVAADFPLSRMLVGRLRPASTTSA